MLTWIPQTPHTCGQACAAILTGRPLAEVVKLSGCRGGTTTKQMAALLRKLGYTCGDKLKTVYKGSLYAVYHKGGTAALLKVSTKGRGGWHWVLFYDCWYYDPSPLAGRRLRPSEFFARCEANGVRVTSFLPITGGVAGG